ncbi:MAG: HDOD domain-containing protein [Bacteroidota bacterium]
MSNTGLLIDDSPTSDNSETLDVFCAALANLIDRKELALPVLPEVPSKVLTMTTNPDMNIAELSNLIHQDQALASHVLRVSNSASYGGTRQIASLTQAITRLGGRLVGDIAFGISLQSDVFQIKGFEKMVRQLWRHAFAAGLFGKEIARLRRRNIEGQYLCGLLHTIGKPVILQACIGLQEELGRTLDKDTATILMNNFHNSVGSILTFSWGLPDLVSKTCLYYTNYEEAPTFKDETIATYLASQLALLIGDSLEKEQEVLRSDPAFHLLNLYPEDVQLLFDKLDSISEIIAAMAI